MEKKKVFDNEIWAMRLALKKLEVYLWFTMIYIVAIFGIIFRIFSGGYIETTSKDTFGDLLYAGIINASVDFSILFVIATSSWFVVSRTIAIVKNKGESK